MINIPGCKRMIFIRSGNYDYAEVDLQGPIHLVGRNNVGKTSIIAAVQFLFIPEQSAMHFGAYTLEDTRRYYFRHPTSYILFECLSAETHSYVTIGLRGLGPIGSYRFERFAFPGRYERSMFVDDNQVVRDFEHIKADIMASRQHFRLLEPKDMRTCLVGTWDDRRLNLGIVPLRDGTSHDRFTRLFRNLLELNKMEQETIKQTLVEIYRREFTKPTIDLQKDHEASFAKLELERRSIDRLDGVAPLVAQLRSSIQKQTSSRVVLKPMYRTLCDVRDEELAKLRAKRNALSRVIQNADGKNSALIDEARTLRFRQTEIVIPLAEAKQNVSAILALQEKYAFFEKELQQSSLKNLVDELEILEGKYHRSGEPAAVISRDIADLEQQHAEKIRIRDTHDNLLGAYLVKELGEHQLKDVFRVLNPKLLERELSTDAIEVDDREALVNALNHIDNLIHPQTKRFSGHGISFPIRAVPGPTSIIPDLTKLTEEIAALEQKLSARRQQLVDAQARETLKSEIEAKKEEINARQRQLDEYLALQEKLNTLPALQAKVEELRALHEAMELRQEEISELLSALSTEKVGALNSRNQVDAQILKIERECFSTPDEDWPEAEDAPDCSGMSFEDIVQRYRNAYIAEREATRSIETQIVVLESRMQDGLSGTTPEDKAGSAIDAIDSLADKRASYDALWSGLVTEIKSSIKEMLSDVDRLSHRVSEFSRRLSSVTVSNLKSISMQVVENRDRIRTYQALFNAGGIFGDSTETGQAIDEVSNLIRGATGKVELLDLFGIEFVVEYANGRTKTFSKLDAIESNGTTMMIKALVNMMLMRDMMKKDRNFAIPFYLDEANQIDEENLKGLVKTATSLGFVPVLASTTPVAVADTLYFVHWAKEGRAVLVTRPLQTGPAGV
ncbi:chromosome partitioning protein ParA, partial [Burkholderia pyrrocinia]|uniref:chromosome partitioning protein ParA n=1 Tax=Burkholderia pyrrocinia TaxID=60550 RepID=UPI001A9E2CCD